VRSARQLRGPFPGRARAGRGRAAAGGPRGGRGARPLRGERRERGLEPGASLGASGRGRSGCRRRSRRATATPIARTYPGAGPKVRRGGRAGPAPAGRLPRLRRPLDRCRGPATGRGHHVQPRPRPAGVARLRRCADRLPRSRGDLGHRDVPEDACRAGQGCRRLPRRHRGPGRGRGPGPAACQRVEGPHQALRGAGLAAGPCRGLRRRSRCSRPGRPERLGTGRFGSVSAPDPRGTRLAGGTPGRGDPALRGHSPRGGRQADLLGAATRAVRRPARCPRSRGRRHRARDGAAAGRARHGRDRGRQAFHGGRGGRAGRRRAADRRGRAGGCAARCRRLDPRRGRPQQPRRARYPRRRQGAARRGRVRGRLPARPGPALPGSPRLRSGQPGRSE